MAFDAFMYLKGGDPEAKGETTDKTYKDKGAFEIYSFSWGASNPVTIGSASTGAGGGKVSISSFNCMKKTDAASPILFLHCCKGSHFDSAHIVLRKAGGEALVYIEYDFEEVFVDSIQWSGSSGGDDTPTESCSFSFGKCEMKYHPQSAKGKDTKAIPASYDIRTNSTT
jgi:type VI secretion system secreted protein Hcp